MSDIKRSPESAGKLQGRLQDKITQTEKAIKDAVEKIDSLPKPDGEIIPLSAPRKIDKKTDDAESWRLESELLRLDELEKKKRFLEQKQMDLKGKFNEPSGKMEN